MIKRSVAVVVRGPEAGTFLVVKRPDDPGDPLAGVWGLPAVTLTISSSSVNGNEGARRLNPIMRWGPSAGARTA